MITTSWSPRRACKQISTYLLLHNNKALALIPTYVLLLSIHWITPARGSIHCCMIYFRCRYEHQTQVSRMRCNFNHINTVGCNHLFMPSIPLLSHAHPDISAAIFLKLTAYMYWKIEKTGKWLALTHGARVTHICVSKLGNHCFG